MKRNSIYSIFLSAGLIFTLSSCEKNEVISPNSPQSSSDVSDLWKNGDGSDSDSDSNTDKDNKRPNTDDLFVTRDGDVDPNDPNGNNSGNGDDGKPLDPNGDSFIGDDNDDSDVGNNSGKSLTMDDTDDGITSIRKK